MEMIELLQYEVGNLNKCLDELNGKLDKLDALIDSIDALTKALNRISRKKVMNIELRTE